MHRFPLEIDSDFVPLHSLCFGHVECIIFACVVPGKPHSTSIHFSTHVGEIVFVHSILLVKFESVASSYLLCVKLAVYLVA